MESDPSDFHDGVTVHHKHAAEMDTEGPARMEDRDLKPDPVIPLAADIEGIQLREAMRPFDLTAWHLGFPSCLSPDALYRRLNKGIESVEECRERASEALQATCLNGGDFEDLSRIDDPQDAAALACVVASELFKRARQAGLHNRLSN